jgi:hypothetical protein
MISNDCCQVGKRLLALQVYTGAVLKLIKLPLKHFALVLGLPPHGGISHLFLRTLMSSKGSMQDLLLLKPF